MAIRILNNGSRDNGALIDPAYLKIIDSKSEKEISDIAEIEIKIDPEGVVYALLKIPVSGDSFNGQ